MYGGIYRLQVGCTNIWEKYRGTGGIHIYGRCPDILGCTYAQGYRHMEAYRYTGGVQICGVYRCMGCRHMGHTDVQGVYRYKGAYGHMVVYRCMGSYRHPQTYIQPHITPHACQLHLKDSMVPNPNFTYQFDSLIIVVKQK